MRLYAKTYSLQTKGGFAHVVALSLMASVK